MGGSQATPAPPQAGASGEVEPLTPVDQLVWATALADAAADMSLANAKMLRQLVPVGRGGDGAMRLRAPPGHGLERFRGTLARALLDAGDTHGPNVQIFEARGGPDGAHADGR